jgi:hypothetical protein
MMKISKIRDAVEEFSGKTSDQARQLAIAGIAVIWILRVGHETGNIKFSHSLLLPLGGFVVALGCDLFHYLYYTVVWSIINSILNCRYHNDNKEVSISGTVHLIPSILFYAKVILTVVAYILLLRYMASQFNSNA